MKIKIYIITLLLSAVLGSCSSSFLDEKPLDFMSATNSFLTQEDIDCSVNNLYYLVRREFYSRDENRPMDYLYGTDIVNGSSTFSYTVSSSIKLKLWKMKPIFPFRRAVSWFSFILSTRFPSKR